MLVTTAALATGCRQFQQHRADLARLHAEGNFQQAARTLDDPQIRRIYGQRSELLWTLDRGAVAQALGDTPRAIELLEQAERTIELQNERSPADVAAMWLLSDASTTYVAEPYEDMYVNVLKLLAQLEAGNLQGGATVEARRLASKADQLRDRFLVYEDAIRRKDESALERARSSSVVATGTGGEFVESPLGTYLTAITFMATGDPSFQSVAARRLLDSINLQSALIGPVRAQDFEDLEGLRRGDRNLLVVALSGRGPTKVARPVGPIPLGTVPIYFQLPELVPNPSLVNSAWLEVEGGQRMPLAFVEDLNAVAAQHHRRMLPLIYARTYARAAAKAIGSVAITEAARKSARDSNQDLVQVVGVLAGLAFMGATEQADVRAWIMCTIASRSICSSAMCSML
ncbi:hypothetical protein J4558_11705 [Leptolyngbya sp. 15MV]|nr:hypothetical protein J4558_11705 [Leptolyngbya sp. 15MV]